ncbi:hypothetical protein ACP275_08G234200 [Erythranthe tilingii]
MEAAPSPPPSKKFTKFETAKQPNNHRSPTARGGASSNTKHHHPDHPAAAQVVFRLLCHVRTAGAVIGNSGSVIRRLETLTGSKIQLEEGLPNCHERVVNIVGDAAVEKRISVGEEETADVSKAQEGLLRVFERVLEVERNSENNERENNERNEFNCCRLLVQTGRVGAVMGKGGKIVDGIRKSSGAKIRVLKKEQVPVCAGPKDELIQITGGTLAVKKALLAVSRLLQGRTLRGEATRHLSSAHSSSADVDKILNSHEDSSSRKVTFRILCSSRIAGGVIGKGGNTLRCLEKETGASVNFVSPASGSTERVAIISALESHDPLFSPAQIAAVRVFARCMEVSVDLRLISGLGKHESVSARILVGSSQVGCVMDEGGRVSPDISIATGAEIILVGPDCLRKCAQIGDNVVQITGNYENVKNAVFQLTGRLRESFFSEAECGHGSYSGIPRTNPNGGGETKLSRLSYMDQIYESVRSRITSNYENVKSAVSQITGRLREGFFSEAECRHCSHSGIPRISPEGRETKLSKLSYVDQLHHLGFVHKSTTSHIPGSQSEPENSARSIQRHVNNSKALTTITSGLKHQSNVRNEEPKLTVKVVVPEKVFDFVYGENGSNLARLREISGATVVVKDPRPGENTGTVIISGTPERIQIAQTLLHAFISF